MTTTTISQDMDQTTARRYAKMLTEGTGLTHIAVTVPLGSWGGHERAWAVTGPYADKIDGHWPDMVRCPACNAAPGDLCTVATDTGRRTVTWVHNARRDVVEGWT